MIWSYSDLCSNFATGKHIRNVCLYFTNSDSVPIVIKMGLAKEKRGNEKTCYHPIPVVAWLYCTSNQILTRIIDFILARGEEFLKNSSLDMANSLLSCLWFAC